MILSGNLDSPQFRFSLQLDTYQVIYLSGYFFFLAVVTNQSSLPDWMSQLQCHYQINYSSNTNDEWHDEYSSMQSLHIIYFTINNVAILSNLLNMIGSSLLCTKNMTNSTDDINC